MRDDLLEADASVRWAVAQFPSLQRRLDAWLQENISVVFEEFEPNPDYEAIVALEKEPFPLTFSAEVGAYINCIRSSLDVLACALVQRYGKAGSDLSKVYFPVASSGSEFMAGSDKGAEFMKRIPLSERRIIESLKPYKEGNKPLWALHRLDIERKHRRLLAVTHDMASFRAQGFTGQKGLVPVVAGKMPGYVPVKGKTAICFWPKTDWPKPEHEGTPHVVITDGNIPYRRPVVTALDEFAHLATSFIKLFDY